MGQEEKIFADGFSFKRNENAPDFVIGRLSVKVDEAIGFLKENGKNGWVNLSVKKARSGNHYIELDTFEPKSKRDEASEKNSPKKPVKASEPESEEDDLF
jgi:hypothetical protein